MLCALICIFNYVAPGSSAIYLEQAGFPPVQQYIYSPASAGTERMHLGACPGGQTVHHNIDFNLFFKCTFFIISCHIL